MSKQLIGANVGSYTFDAGLKTVTLSGISNLTLDQVLLITNVTTNTKIYQFNNPLLGGFITSNIITLNFDTTTMSNTDILQIYVELEDSDYQKAIRIVDSSGNELDIVDGRLPVSSKPPSPGPSETLITRTLIGTYSGSDNDNLYTITNGKTLTVNFFSVSGESNGKGMQFSLYEDPNGDLSVLNKYQLNFW